MSTKRIYTFTRSKDKVIPYLHLRLRVDIQIDMPMYLRPLPQVLPPDRQPNDQPIPTNIELLAQEAREVEGLAGEGMN